MTNPPIGRVGKNPQISQKTQMSRAPPSTFPPLAFQFSISNFQFPIFNFQFSMPPFTHSPVLKPVDTFSPVGYIEVVT